MIIATKPSLKLLPSLFSLPLVVAVGCGGGAEQSKSPDYPTAEPQGGSVPPAAAPQQPAGREQQPQEEQPSEAPPAPSPGGQPGEETQTPQGGADPWGSSSQGAPAEPQARSGKPAPASGAGASAAGASAAPDVDEQELTQFAKTYAEVVSVQREHQREARSAASRDELQGIQSSMEEDIENIIEDSPFSRARFDTIAQALGRNESLRSRFEQKMRALQ